MIITIICFLLLDRNIEKGFFSANLKMTARFYLSEEYFSVTLYKPKESIVPREKRFSGWKMGREAAHVNAN